MTNPVFARNQAFNPRPVATMGRQANPAAAQQAPAAAQTTLAAEQLQAMYTAPAAGAAQTGRITYDDVIVKTAGLLAVVVILGAATWMVAPQLWPIGAIAGLVLAFVNIFKREPSPALILAYAACQGVFLGGISKFYEEYTAGVVVQALAATGAVFGVTLALFASGKVRASGRATKIFFIAFAGYIVFALINLVLVLTGAVDGFGMYQYKVAGIPLALVVGILVVLIGAYSFVLDFEAVKVAVESGQPRKLAWTAAFAMMVTIVWLYLELLRIIAILRNN
ncbi:MAG: Bax inhibitor-1/YccA family protein [Micrococcales bacterium]|nr:Bax inhibitor-1/YccA family protein [Micrococcales bacterium]